MYRMNGRENGRKRQECECGWLLTLLRYCNIGMSAVTPIRTKGILSTTKLVFISDHLHKGGWQLNSENSFAAICWGYRIIMYIVLVHVCFSKSFTVIYSLFLFSVFALFICSCWKNGRQKIRTKNYDGS